MTTENEIRTQIAASLDGPVSAELLDEMTYAYIDIHGPFQGVTADLHQLVTIFTDGKVTADVTRLSSTSEAAMPMLRTPQTAPTPAARCITPLQATA